MKNNNYQIKTLTESDLAEAARKRSERSFAASFYLGLRPDVNFRAEANSVLAEEAKKIKTSKAYDKNDKKKILKLIDSLKEKINYLKWPQGAGSLVFFLKERTGVQVYRIPAHMRSRLAIGSSFYIRPLKEALEEFPRYLVAAVERDRAEFFIIYLGELQKDPEVIVSDVPKKIKTSASDDWKGRREKRIERHIEDHLARHFKSVAEKIDDYFHGNKYDHLILAGHKEILSEFKKFIAKRTAEKLIGSFTLEHYDHRGVLQKSKEIIDDYEKKAEEGIVKQLMTSLETRNEKWRAAVGTDAAIKNILRRNASMLVIARNYREKGYICRGCRFLARDIGKCPSCARETMEENDLANEIITEALKQKIKIKHLIRNYPDLDRYGIGVFLKKY